MHIPEQRYQALESRECFLQARVLDERELVTDTFLGELARARLASRSYSIAGGTTQVNKNVIAQRVLGLPRSY